MAEETKPNLEPVEENDLDLKSKFVGNAEKPAAKENAPGLKAEKIFTPEIPLEKTEQKEGTVEREQAYQKIISKVSSAAPTTQDEVKADAESASREQDAESKIKNLVQLAEMKGIPHAVKVARHLEDNYTLDEFHDQLLGEELHKALVQKGLIKEF